MEKCKYCDKELWQCDNICIGCGKLNIKYGGLWTPQYLAENLLFPKPVSIQLAELKLISWAHDIIKENVPKWIDASDDKVPRPEFGKAVLVRLKSGYISVGYRKVEANGGSFKTTAWQIFGDIIDAQNSDELTHWMPLPKAPSSKTNNLLLNRSE